MNGPLLKCSQINDMDRKLQESQVAFCELKKDVEQKLQINDMATKFENEIVCWQSEVAILRNEIKVLKEQNERNLKTIAENATEIRDYKKQKDENLKTIAANKTKIEDLEMQIQSTEEKIAANAIEIKDLTKQNGEKDAKIKYFELPLLQKWKLDLVAFVRRERPTVTGDSEQGKIYHIYIKYGSAQSMSKVRIDL